MNTIIFEYEIVEHDSWGLRTMKASRLRGFVNGREVGCMIEHHHIPGEALRKAELIRTALWAGLHWHSHNGTL